MSHEEISVPEDLDGQRLDRWLKKYCADAGFGNVQKAIRKGLVRIDGKRCKPETTLSAGQIVKIPAFLKSSSETTQQRQKNISENNKEFIRSLVIYEDEHIFALNKPAGLAVQGGSKTTRHIDGMLEGLATRKKGEFVKPRLVHRLDKETSGLMVVARSAEAARRLMHIFQGHDVTKTYYALCAGRPEQLEGLIDARLAKQGRSGYEKVMHDPENGQKALTDFEVVDHAADQACLIAFQPQTGRTHQIRVHAALIDCPLIGDHKYNDDPFPFPDIDLADRLHLHAHSLEFKHPFTNKPLTLKAPLPKDFKHSLDQLGLTLKG